MVKNKKIFVLDDSEDRIKWFIDVFGEENTEYAYDPIAAFKKLENESSYDMIFLDHDLGGPFTRGPKGDGIDLVNKIVEKSMLRDNRIILHSLNPDGSRNMAEKLKTAGYTNFFQVPFSWIVRLQEHGLIEEIF